MRKRTLIALTFVASVAVPALVMGQQRDTSHVPKGTTVLKNTGKEAERVGDRTGKAVSKGAKDTGKQVKRTGKSLKRAVSRKARQEAKSEQTPAKTP
jgi:outer membrane usher protein FimD/PapC